MIDVFFFRLLLLSEVQLILLVVALVYFGGFLGFLFAKPKAPMRRVNFWLYLAGCNFLFSAAQLGWLYIGLAAEYGLFSALSLVIWGTAVLFGYLVYHISAARSLNITGSPKKAWAAFVPFGVFWLLFARGRHWSEDDEPIKSGFSKYVNDPAVLLTAIALAITGRSMETYLEKFEHPEHAPEAAIVKLAERAQTIEEIFAQEVLLSSPGLPEQIDYGLTLQSLSNSGQKLYFRFVVDGPMDDFQYGHFPWLLEQYCQPEVFGAVVDKGGSLIFSVSSKEDRRDKNYTISKTDCSI
ncbi:MAG: hypothetical protein ACRBB0_08010 [Pelagimonas sp.]|uniref:hypothetical protein n=1 Tax=Pelagimonas sp. TaxID=2073170 RepID=UPI003D6C0C79